MLIAMLILFYIVRLGSWFHLAICSFV